MGDTNNYDQQHHPHETEGYGGAAPPRTWDVGTQPLEFPFHPSANDAGDFYDSSLSGSSQENNFFGSHEASSSSNAYFGSSSYGNAVAVPEPPEQVSYGIPTPGEMPFHSSSNPPVQMPYHPCDIESSPQRPESLPFDVGQPPQAIGTALQHLPSTNSSEHLAVPAKVTDVQLNDFTLNLKAEPWFTNQKPEPQSITPTEAYSRFRWLVYEHPGGRWYCRIPHLWSRGVKKGQLCDHNVLMLKDAIAHVREYYKYAPYPCCGDGQHKPCPKRFYTTERRHDHYSKTRAEADKKVKCAHCNTETLNRNLRRHIQKKHPGLPV